jgi:hypothetical protein
MKVKNSTMQAYPFIEPHEDDNIKAYHPGMTMRDEFAKAAMQLQQWHDPDDIYLNHADRCYEIADAMMRARK